MPSLEWNRRWALDFKKWRTEHPNKFYGSQWGDPNRRGIRYFLRRWYRPREAAGPLFVVVDEYIKPYVNSGATVLEIGCGGGRWTRYLTSAKKIIAVDINAEFFAPLKEMLPTANLEFYQPNGFNLDGVAAESVDFVFSFGTFVHIEPGGIRQYLVEIQRVLKAGGVAVVHYAAKEKPAGRANRTFSEMTAEKMAAMAPMPIVAHNTHLLNHSNIAVFRK